MIQISVIMPVRNEANSISKVIKALALQERTLNNFKIKLIVVDGRSNDGTAEKAFGSILLFEDNFFEGVVITNIGFDVSAPANFNLGYSILESEYIFRLDGHSILSSNYIDSCIEVFNKLQNNEKSPVYVSGQLEHITDESGYFSKGIPIAMNSQYVTAFAWRSERKFGITEVETAVFFLSKKIFFEVGGIYDLEMKKNEDDLHSFKFRKNGGKIYLTSKCKAFQIARSSLYELARQYLLWGFYKPKVFRKSGLMPRISLILYFLLSLFAVISIFFYGFYLILGLLILEIVFFIYIYKSMFLSVYLASFVMRVSYLIGILIGISFIIKK
jgi:glycosyltransferase involved in cell wall biosynthesis